MMIGINQKYARTSSPLPSSEDSNMLFSDAVKLEYLYSLFYKIYQSMQLICCNYFFQPLSIIFAKVTAVYTIALLNALEFRYNLRNHFIMIAVYFSSSKIIVKLFAPTQQSFNPHPGNLLFSISVIFCLYGFNFLSLLIKINLQTPSIASKVTDNILSDIYPGCMQPTSFEEYR
jgi:hypothetical protein